MFKNQILEDIKIIQEDYAVNNPLLQKEDYAFNYWILTRLFNIDEEVADEYVTEYRDDGVDCFVFFEDSKELYIIQNKYYSEQTELSKDYVQTDFLTRPLAKLASNTYTRSEKLQTIFNKYKNDPDFSIFLQLYVSNNNRNSSIIEIVKRYQKKELSVAGYVTAEIFYLNDIEKKYFGERKTDKKNFVGYFYTRNKGTVLNINRENYDLPNLIEAKYLLMPVDRIYSLVKEANEKDYSLFAENIRDYLGKNKINTKIAKTLEDDDDRANFFYYNNGITVICDNIKQEHNNELNLQIKITTTNPQIVNGCQTVNSIFQELDRYQEDERKIKFSETFVMVKLLKLDADNDEHKSLYEAIVKYNNSQNAINEKQFAANQSIFKNLQKEFEKRGFLLAVKQSDKNTFKSSKKFNDFRPKLNHYSDIFNIEFKSINDIIIPIEKLLQVLLAFYKDGYYAYTKKCDILKQDSYIYSELIKFIKSDVFTIENILCLYLLFIKADKEKKQSEDQRTPIPFYLIGFLGRQLKSLDNNKKKISLDFIFESKDKLDSIYFYYKFATLQYKNYFKTNKSIEYNKMIKTAIDEDVLSNSLVDAKEFVNLSFPIFSRNLKLYEEIIQS